MNTLMLVLMPATFGVDFGWERHSNNAVTFVVQARPGELDTAGLSGSQLIDRLPREYQFIKSYNYRIRTGIDPVPNQGTVPPEYSQLLVGTSGGTTSPGYSPPGGFSSSSNSSPWPTPSGSTYGQVNTYPAGYSPGYAPTPNGYTPTPSPTPSGYAWQPTQPGYPNGYGYPPNVAGAGVNATGGVPTIDPNYYNQGPRLVDPQSIGAAKPNIEPGMPTATAGGFAPNHNYYQQPYAQPGYVVASAPGALPNGQPAATAEPKSPADAKAAGTTAVEPPSQWASLTFALVALFASLGANFYLGWTTYHLRERYRLMLADRPTY